jgi:hypothetical protein
VVDGNGIGLGGLCGLKRYFRCHVGLSGLGDYGMVCPPFSLVGFKLIYR